ncbi:MAG: hypothetical protein LBG64_04090 [Pseudomonadales bacterium]|jgi:2-isopropylmalate synthase|nr:hypothetical protein [Pseudomonadales bacterium]
MLMWQSPNKLAQKDESEMMSENLSLAAQFNYLSKTKTLANFDWDVDEFEGVPFYEALPACPTKEQWETFRINDDTLRDGLGGLRIVPSVEKTIRYIESAYDLGIRNLILSIYVGEGTSSDKLTKAILTHFKLHPLPDLKFLITIPIMAPAIEWAKKCVAINPEMVEIAPFIGTAPSRLFIENWSKEFVLDKVFNSVSELSKESYSLRCVIEHATQTSPDFLEKILTAQLQASGNKLESIILTDTIGCGTPQSIYRLFWFAKKVLRKNRADQVSLEFHAHNDTGMALTNALSAISAGATYIDTTARGIGERAGNLSLESLLLTAFRMQMKVGANLSFDWSKMENYLNTFHDLSGLSKTNYGVMCATSHTTGYGTHGAALEKYRQLQVYGEEKLEQLQKQLFEAQETQKRIDEMAGNLYNAIDPARVGKSNQIIVGPQIGIKGLNYVLSKYNINLSKEQLISLRTRVTMMNKEIADEELVRMANELL